MLEEYLYFQIRHDVGVFAVHSLINFQGRNHILAHSLLVERQDGTFQISVRAPLAKPYGAEILSIKFAGGGRAIAAGINDLAPEEVELFYEAFEKQFLC